MYKKILIISAVIFMFLAGNVFAQTYYVPPVNYNQNYIPNYNSNYNYNYNNSYASQVSFSQSNITLQAGQSTNIILYGGYNYYISSNSSLVGTGISGNVLSVYGNSAGTGFLTICANGASCNNLYVTVYGNINYNYNYNYNYQYQNQYYPNYLPNYYQNNYQNQSSIYLSQNSINMSAGQNQSISIFGGYNNYYVSSNSNSSVAVASINGNTLNVYAYSAGNANITVCQNSGSCTSLYVSVSGNNYNYTPYYPPVKMHHFMNRPY